VLQKLKIYSVSPSVIRKAGGELYANRKILLPLWYAKQKKNNRGKQKDCGKIPSYNS
jgi:hypothetical protein